VKKTNRGFQIYGEYKDSKGSTIKIQESSGCGGPFVWIFCKDRDGKDVVPCVGAAGGHISIAPHLTRAQARRVAKALLEFAK